jgi:hypothetical protein
VARGMTGGIFAIETAQWWGGLRDRSTIRPVLDLLSHGTEGGVDYVHRSVSTREELVHHVGRWRRTKRFPILFLAMHGGAGRLFLDHRQREGSAVTLDELAEMIGSGCEGRMVHFGACSVLGIHLQHVRRFIKRTGVLGVTGFRRPVDWVQSCSVELQLLATLMRYRANLRGARRMETALAKEAPHLQRQSGLRVVVR